MELSSKNILITTSIIIFISSLVISKLIKFHTPFFVFYFISWTLYWHAISPVFADNSPWATLPLAAVFNVAFFLLLSIGVNAGAKKIKHIQPSTTLTAWSSIYIGVIFFIPIVEHI